MRWVKYKACLLVLFEEVGRVGYEGGVEGTGGIHIHIGKHNQRIENQFDFK